MDFILDHPYLIILALYALFAIFGKKKVAQVNEANKQAQAQAQEAKRSQARAQGAKEQGTKEQYRGRIEEALRNAMKDADIEFSETRSLAGDEPKPQPPKIVNPGAPALASASADPFAFHSVMNAGEKGRVDYDKSATDYDLTAVDYDKRTSAFEFRQAIAEPVEKEYHMTGFGFHAAGGLNAEDRRKAAAEEVAEAPVSGPAFSFGNREDLRRAIIIQEVLGKPKGLRKG